MFPRRWHQVAGTQCNSAPRLPATRVQGDVFDISRALALRFDRWTGLSNLFIIRFMRNLPVTLGLHLSLRSP
jgi:hypothetical protein